MQIKIFDESFEEKISTDYGHIKYRIIYPRCEYPVRTEAEGRINDEMIAIALSARSFIRNRINETQNSEKNHGEYISDYSFEIRPTYTGNLFMSFILETIMTTNTKKTEVSYSARTYKISSARNITLEMLFRNPKIKDMLWEKILYSSYSSEDLFRRTSFEDFLTYYKNTDFFLTSKEIILFFPPMSIIPQHDKYILIPIKYEELNGYLKYRFD